MEREVLHNAKKWNAGDNLDESPGMNGEFNESPSKVLNMCDSIYITFWNDNISEMENRVVAARSNGLGKGRSWEGEHEGSS